MAVASLNFHLGLLLSHLKAFYSEDEPAPPTHSLLTLASTSHQAEIVLQWEREKINTCFPGHKFGFPDVFASPL